MQQLLEEEGTSELVAEQPVTAAGVAAATATAMSAAAVAPITPTAAAASVALKAPLCPAELLFEQPPKGTAECTAMADADTIMNASFPHFKAVRRTSKLKPLSRDSFPNFDIIGARSSGSGKPGSANGNSVPKLGERRSISSGKRSAISSLNSGSGIKATL
jgi:hypothetical protein